MGSEQDRFYSTMFEVDEPHPIKIMEEPDREGRSSTDFEFGTANMADGLSSNKSGDSQRKNNKVPLEANAMMDEVMDGILKNRESRNNLGKGERASYADPVAFGDNSRTFRESRLGQDAPAELGATELTEKIDKFSLGFGISNDMNDHLGRMRQFELQSKQEVHKYVASKGAT